MRPFLKFLVGFDLFNILGLLVLMPLFVLPVTVVAGLLMATIGIAPFRWEGLFFNWVLFAVLFEALFVYTRVQEDWRMFRVLQENGQLLAFQGTLRTASESTVRSEQKLSMGSSTSIAPTGVC